MAEIQINDQYRLKSDEHQWKIESATKHKGEIRWRPISYHPSLHKACNALLQRAQRLCSGRDMETIRVELERLSIQMREAVSPMTELQCGFDIERQKGQVTYAEVERIARRVVREMFASQ